MALTSTQEKAVYNPNLFLHVDAITLSEETKSLLSQSEKVYSQNFDGKTWYGRCIFVSWYCSLADCTFCFRSTNRHKKQHPSTSKRSMGSILLEALFSKVFHWRIEFLTGGYGTMPFNELLEIIENVSLVYEEKVWLNFGVLPPSQLKLCQPYVKGIFSSLETLHPELHKQVCPSKPIEPYGEMFSNMEGFKKSVAVIVGLGEELEDIKYLFDFVEKHSVDRVTIYALKPVSGTPYKEGPNTNEYLQWIASLRIRFPKLEIVAGTNLRRSEEAGYLMKAGANAITKFPATKQFGTKKAKLIKELIENENRTFTSNITVLPEINWDEEIKNLSIKDKYKQEMKRLLPSYLESFSNPLDKDKSLIP